MASVAVQLKIAENHLQTVKNAFYRLKIENEELRHFENEAS